MHSPVRVHLQFALYYELDVSVLEGSGECVVLAVFDGKEFLKDIKS